MIIAINNAYERVNSLVRTHLSNYDPTRYTTSDLSTGTEVPKFNSLFHDLLALWPSYEHSVRDNKPIANAFLQQIQLKEKELELWYGARSYKIFTVTIASPGVATLDNHGLNTNDKIILETTGALPTGLSAATWYYAIKVTDHTFQISATRDGAAINTSVSQSGTHYIGREAVGGFARGRVQESNK